MKKVLKKKSNKQKGGFIQNDLVTFGKLITFDINQSLKINTINPLPWKDQLK